MKTPREDSEEACLHRWFRLACLAALLAAFCTAAACQPNKNRSRSTSKYVDETKQPVAGLLPPPPGPIFDGTTHTAWTRRDGAPGSITSLAQTSDGYLWIGSALGLYRFDGLRFAAYPFDPAVQPLPSLDVASIAADGLGGLWIAMRSAAVVHLRAEGTTERFGRAEGITAATLETIFVRPDGTVWLTGGSSLYRLEGHTWIDYRKRGLWSGGVFSVLFDREGNIWIGRDKRLAIFRKGASKFEDLPDSVHYVSSMVQSPTGAIWIADAWRSVRLLSDTSSEGAFHIQGKAELLLDRDDNLWIGQDDEGLARIKNVSRPGPPAAVEQAHLSELSAKEIHALLEDREGNIWVGTDRGLDRIKKTPFVPFLNTELRYFPSMIAAEDGAVWINSHGSSLMRVLDGQTTPIGFHVNTGPLAKRLNGDICFVDLTSYELQCYGAQATSAKLPDSMQHVPPKSLVEDADGSLLLSTQGKGVWRYAEGAWTPFAPQGTKLEGPWTLYRDSSQRLWFGYGNDRVVVREGLSYRGVKVEDSFWSNTLTFSEGAGLLWAAGSSGLCYFDGQQFKRVLSLDPRLFNGTSGIAFDGSGSMWLNSGAGILRISPDELVRLKNNPAYLVRAEVFDENDGIVGQPTQYKRAPSAIVDRRGVLWFATSGNVVSLDPSRVGVRETLPSVLIESVLVDGKPALPAPSQPGAVLKTSSNRLHDLEINYIGINLSAPERVSFRYRLVGEDKEWQDAGHRRQAFYTRLAPGTYEFRVSASNGGDWSDLSNPLRIEVRPAFYQTWWFELAAMAAFAAVAWIVLRTRARRLAERMHARVADRLAERERVARELHDGLLQGFQGLMMRFHLATQSIPPSEPARSEMEEALDCADEILVQSRDRIRDLRYQPLFSTSLSDALSQLQQDLRPQAGADLSLSTQGSEREINPASCEEIYAVAREAILNACKHSGGSRVDVALVYEPMHLRIQVSDDGCGVSGEILETRGKSDHWGIPGMFERAETLKAKLTIQCPAGEGTEVELIVPGSVAYRDRTGSTWRSSELRREQPVGASRRPDQRTHTFE